MTTPDIESLIAVARERHVHVEPDQLMQSLATDGRDDYCICGENWPCPDRLLIDGMTAVLELIETHDNFALHGSCTPLGKAARAALGDVR